MSPSSPDRAHDDGPAIRPARREDIDALVAIENASFAADRLSRRSFLRLVGSSTAIALVAEREAVLGSCIVLLRGTSHRARLYSLAVAPHATGQRIGSALLRAAEEAAALQGSRLLTLEVREDNAPARSLYAKSGFELIGRTPGYYSDGEAALHFRKSLAPIALGAAA